MKENKQQNLLKDVQCTSSLHKASVIYDCAVRSHAADAIQLSGCVFYTNTHGFFDHNPFFLYVRLRLPLSYNRCQRFASGWWYL